tara:strand:- start:1342 stop:2526 length:1185 start_codon:yes stop_codon:yes gene_type:complete
MSGHEVIGKEELNSIKEIFTKSNGVLFAHGFEAKRNNIFRVKEFERKLSKYLNCKYVACCSSGTAAGYLSLKALNIGSGDEVIVQSFTFIAAIESIIQTGATPIVVDSDNYLGMDSKDLESKITKKTKCIMPVHMLGESANMKEILKVSKKYNLPIVEDACEALGAKYKNKYLGTLGEVGFFSLDFGKIITSGEGGFICTDNTKIYNKIKALRDHGHENKKGVHRGKDKAIEIGFNYRLSELQAAVGIAQLKKIKTLIKNKKKNKLFIKNYIKSNVKNNNYKFRPCYNPKSEQYDHLVIYLKNKVKAKNFYKLLEKEKIGTGILPVASKWHYAGYWDHIWKNSTSKKHNKYGLKFWKNTWNIINRAVSIHISSIEKIEKIREKSKKIVNILNSN